jgi:excisionase family DNA binding protein
MSEVVSARGVLLSDGAAREVVAALDLLARLAAPRGQQLSPRLQQIKRELLNSSARAAAHGDASAETVADEKDAHWEASVADTATAAQLLGITPGGVAWLCRNGRLRATRSGGRWHIDTASLRTYAHHRKDS